LTFYVRIKAVQPPKPVLIRDRCFLTYGTTVINAGQTLTVEKGATVGANYGVQNQGGDGTIAVQLYDSKSGKVILNKQFTLAGGQQRIESLGTFTVNADMDLSFIAYYWDGAKWVQTDSYGTPWWLKKAIRDKYEAIGYLKVR